MREYATEVEKKILDAVESEGSERKAAKKLGISKGTVSGAVARVRKRAAKFDPQLHNHQAPPGYRLKGVSTLLDSDGQVRQTWVKTAADSEDPGAFIEAFKLAVEGLDKVKPVKAPESGYADLLSAYPIGDAHLGMLAWGVETGTDFDLKIAEANLVSAMSKLVSLSPPSERALVLNVGDYHHADSSSATTTAGTRLDVDSRYGKMLQVGLRVFLFCVYEALRKHAIVHVVINRGNHDFHTSYMLSIAVQEHFRNEPRVVMEPLPKAYTYLEFGKNLIGTTHGNLCKLDRLPLIMANDQEQAWGRTKFRHWYVGHFHHAQVKEHGGCTTETIRTLAASDAWHHDSGYRAGRSMFADVWHRDYGQISRSIVGIDALS